MFSRKTSQPRSEGILGVTKLVPQPPGRWALGSRGADPRGVRPPPSQGAGLAGMGLRLPRTVGKGGEGRET